MNMNMNSSIWDQSIRDFIVQAASPQPAPGGGSIAALVGALAASMTSMAAQLSLGEKFAAFRPQMDDAINMMQRLIIESEQLLESDIDAFESYMEAFRKPRNTAEEQQARSQAMQKVIRQTIDIPLRLIQLCHSGIACTHSLVQASNRNVISDLAIGAILFDAAAQSALMTIELNLSYLQDAALRSDYERQVSLIMKDIDQLKVTSLQQTRERIIS